MTTTLLETTSQGWDHTADAYNEMHQSLQFTNVYCLDTMKLAFTNESRDGLKILDVAAGTGALSLQVAEYLKDKNATVLATDFSPKMIEKLEQNKDKLKLENVECKVMDGQALDLPDETFDYGFSVFGLIFFPRRDLGMKEFHRVLKKGGKVVICSWKFTPVMKPVKEALSRLQDQTSSSNPPQKPSPVMSLSNPDQFKSELESAGFQDVVIHQVSHPMMAEHYEDVVRGMASNPVVVSMEQEMGTEKAALFEKTFLQVLKELYPTEPLSLDSAAYIGIGTKL